MNLSLLRPVVAWAGELMKRAVFAVVAMCLGIVGPALGADLPPAPPASAPAVYTPIPVAPPFSWTGFYIGGNAGYSWGQQNTSLSIADGPTNSDCHFCEVSGVFLDQAAILGAGSPNFSPSGFTGGIQAGYNWQLPSLWVLGFETDFDSYQLRQTKDTSTTMPQITALGVCTATCVANFSTAVSTNWLFTARPRIGYGWNQTLFFVTGGVAVSQVRFSQTYSDNINNPPEGPGIESASASKTLVGWTAGAGVEQALTLNWTIKAEYLYSEFGGFTVSGILRDSTTTDFSNFTKGVGHLTSSTVRGGVNYKF
jgi:outer membrane immunogenic protein